MTAYAVVELAIVNVEGMGPYLAGVAETIAAHGGKYLVRPGPAQLAGNAEIIEGGGHEHPIKVILEFPDIATAKGWYDSAEYQAILPYRRDNSTGTFVWVEGV